MVVDDEHLGQQRNDPVPLDWAVFDDDRLDGRFIAGGGFESITDRKIPNL